MNAAHGPSTNTQTSSAAQPPRVRPGGPMGGPGALMPGERARNFKKSMAQLFAFMGKYKWLIAGVLLIAAVANVFTIFGPKMLGEATTNLFDGVRRRMAGDTQGIDLSVISRILTRVALLYVMSALLSFIQGYLMVGIAADITYRFRQDISKKINHLPLKYFDKVTYGEVLSRVTNDVDTISTTLNQSLSQMVSSVVSVVGILIMMFTISLPMTLIALTIIPLSIVFIRVIIQKSQGFFKTQQAYLGHINGLVEENYGGHVVVKAFNHEEASVAAFGDLNTVLYDSAWKSQLLSTMIMPIMRFIGNLGYVAVSILGGYLVIRNQLSLGNIQAFIQYMRSFQEPLMQIANISNILQQTAAAAERVFEFLNEPEESPDCGECSRPEQIRGAVEFRHVRFGYDPEKPIIKDFSLKVEPGQQVAIVGPTGAGKTTLVKLLMRFYEIDSGEILVDGNNIKDMTRDYDVIATLNLNGDYLSDALAAQVGGIGIAPGANINYETGHAIFEATHGTAPKYADLDKVNPGSVILSGEMMLRYMGWTEAADLIVKGMEGAVAAKTVTYDFARLMDGATEVKCSEFADAMIKAM